jgi:hypothetical protein
VILTSTIAAAVAGETVRATLLGEFRFASGTQRLWMGRGQITTGGHTWQGIGTLVALDIIPAPTNLAAPEIRFTLSGVDDTILTTAQDAAAEVKNRPFSLLLQCFRVGTNVDGQDWGLLDDPMAIMAGLMDQLSFSGQGATDRQMVLTGETLFVGRNRPPYSYYSHLDQRRRFDGDNGLKQLAALANRKIKGWPT